MANPPRRLGAHCSIAGSLESAAEEAIGLGCNCLQIFSRSPRIWRSRELGAAEIERFADLRRQHDLRPLVIHASYLLNLASADPENREKSVEGFREEVERALAIGADYLVLHPGSSKDQEVGAAIEGLASAFAAATSNLAWNGLTVLFENTAGGGASLGRTFAELASIRDAIRLVSPAPLGFCLDTAHTFASGHEIRNEAALDETLRVFHASLGIDALHVIHFNDSKTKLGSRLDRHARLGEGHIGWDAMARVLHHPCLRNKPFILETPHDESGTHRRSVRDLKRMLRGSAAPRRLQAAGAAERAVR